MKKILVSILIGAVFGVSGYAFYDKYLAYPNPTDVWACRLIIGYAATIPDRAKALKDPVEYKANYESCLYQAEHLAYFLRENGDRGGK